jgi:hypothetical protein
MYLGSFSSVLVPVGQSWIAVKCVASVPTVPRNIRPPFCVGTYRTSQVRLSSVHGHIYDGRNLFDSYNCRVVPKLDRPFTPKSIVVFGCSSAPLPFNIYIVRKVLLLPSALVVLHENSYFRFC